jgi:plastocyanin
MSKWLLVVGCAVVVSAWGCGGGGSEAPKAGSSSGSASSASGAATDDGVTAGADATASSEPPGSIKGKISWVGGKPRVIKIRMSADPYCDEANGGGAERMAPRVSEDGGMPDIFVYVKAGLGKAYSAPSDKVMIDQSACNYSPRVVGAMVDQPIEIMNSDATLHNVHALPDNSKGFNLGMPTKGMKSTRKFAVSEVFVRIKCDVHPWMETYVGVVENPFHAVSDDDGSFEISGVPPGEYTIEAAHPRIGRKTATVTVASGAAVTADFELAPAK